MATVTKRLCALGLAAPVRLLLNGRHLRTVFATSRRIVGEHPSNKCRSIQTSAKRNKIWEVPSQLEAEELRKLYHSPKSLTEDLLQPLVACSMVKTSQVVLTPRLGGKFWRARLVLQWPSKVTISAVHSSITGAEENVYLLACDLFKNMGLLYQDTSGCMKPVSKDYAITLLRTLHSFSPDPFRPLASRFHFSTSPEDIASHQLDGDVDLGNKHYCTNVAASWPFGFNLCCSGPTYQASQHVAALLTCTKLKAFGLLSHKNHLNESRLPGISHRLRCRAERKGSTTREDFDPDFEIYSDASAFGFGAYLVQKEDDRVHWLANTWSEHFPDSPRIQPRKTLAEVDETNQSVLLESTFCELYSVVTAIFTWKHKLAGRKVLVWTDSSTTVQLVNWGVQGESKQKRWGKLCHILAATCHKYSIELCANHIQRTQNTAADFLSRSNLAGFKKVVPEAASSRKKTKKLLFWNPLQAPHIDLHHKFM